MCEMCVKGARKCLFQALVRAWKSVSEPAWKAILVTCFMIHSLIGETENSMKNELLTLSLCFTFTCDTAAAVSCGFGGPGEHWQEVCLLVSFYAGCPPIPINTPAPQNGCIEVPRLLRLRYQPSIRPFLRLFPRVFFPFLQCLRAQEDDGPSN